MSFTRHTGKRKISEVDTRPVLKNKMSLPSIKNTPILDFKIDKEFLELFNYIETLHKIEYDSHEYDDHTNFCMEAITGQTHIGKEIYELSGKRVNICLCVYGDKQPFVHFNTRCWIDNEPLYPKFNIYERYFILHYLLPVINPDFKYNLLSELIEVYTKSKVDY